MDADDCWRDLHVSFVVTATISGADLLGFMLRNSLLSIIARVEALHVMNVENDWVV